MESSQDMSLVFTGEDLRVITPTALSEPRETWFTPTCAERDLHALAVIEEFGEIDEMPSAWLAAAGLNWLQARRYCLLGNENGGVALYDRIIAGGARMSNESTVNARVRR